MSALVRLLRHPPTLWVPLLLHRAETIWRKRWEAWRDRRASTFFRRALPRLKNRLCDLPDANSIGAESPWLAPVSQLFLEHRFDWLGTGWRSLGYRDLVADVDGHWLQALVGPLNLDEARSIWRLIDSHDYCPIDWHSDHRASYRWDARQLASDLPVYPGMGADIKQPWELARLQHLPLLALAYHCSASGLSGFVPAERYRREFRNCVLDFLATNPPRHGVNWMGSMEVAIRIANILIARDLFCAAGAAFDDGFERILAQATFAHGLHIRAHLEKRPDSRGNHYLANLAGLLYTSAYLGRVDAASAWWTFAYRQMEQEIEHQFHADGSNFEGSTSYHRLSGEIALWSAALILGEGASLSHEVQTRLAGIGRFTESLTRPDGVIPMIGDVDSGRFVKLSGAFETLAREDALALYPHLHESAFSDNTYWDEALDQHKSLLCACNALQDGSVATVEAFILRKLAKDCLLEAVAPRVPMHVNAASWDTLLANIRQQARHPAIRYTLISAPQVAPAFHAYPEFGLYVIRDRDSVLTVRCGPNGQNGNGGHGHNDQLSITYCRGAAVLIEDPGTAIYNSDPILRNAYRSVKAHFSPHPQHGEPASLEMNPFLLPSGGEGTCLYFGERGFIGQHKGYGYPVSRVVYREAEAWVIEDYSNGDALVELSLTLDGHWITPLLVARKYGRPKLK